MFVLNSNRQIQIKMDVVGLSDYVQIAGSFENEFIGNSTNNYYNRIANQCADIEANIHET